MSDNNNDDDQTKKAIDFLWDQVERQGAACSTVKDGHVLTFKLSFLKEIVEKYSDREHLTIFVQRPDFKN